jgi:hypothetical protein
VWCVLGCGALIRTSRHYSNYQSLFGFFSCGEHGSNLCGARTIWGHADDRPAPPPKSTSTTSIAIGSLTGLQLDNASRHMKARLHELGHHLSGPNSSTARYTNDADWMHYQQPVPTVLKDSEFGTCWLHRQTEQFSNAPQNTALQTPGPNPT